ncbi:MAG: hypothetical protein ACM3OA_13365 [Acidobacteriota bacterium]
MSRWTNRWSGTLLAAALLVAASAHVGSPDTFFEGDAGPYRIRVIVRPPGIVPGQAEITVRLLAGSGVRAVLVQPLRGGRPTALEPPPDSARRVPGGQDLYSAQLWLMEGGAYSIRVDVAGTAGEGEVIVPVNSIATRRLGFDTPLAIALLGLGVFLFIGAITIVGAAVRESVLAPGMEPDAARRRRSWWIRILAVPLLALAVFAGKKWWDADDAAHSASLYRPMQVRTAIAGSGVLTLAITDSEWLGRQFSPLIPDHGKLMHLFLVRDDLQGFAHLHPLMVDSSTFRTSLPPLGPGRYRLYADVVHESGFTQTLVDSVTLAGSRATWSAGDADDSWWSGYQLSAVSYQQTAQLEDGSVMTWIRDSAPIVAGRDLELRFTVHTKAGQAVQLEPYMGMSSHAVIARDDGSVFVHLHPSGTIAMASQLAYTLRQPGDTVRGVLGARITSAERTESPMVGMEGTLGTVTLPYAFPKPGRYRIWVQVKVRGRILTGAFDGQVTQ